MNKLIASTAFVVAAALSGAAFAEQATIDSGGNAPQIAHLGTLSVFQDFTSPFVDPATAFVNANTKIVKFPSSVINYAGQLGIKSANGAITSGLTAPFGFVDKVNYTATATFGALSTSYSTDGSTAPLAGTNKNNVAVGPAGPATVQVNLVLTPIASPAVAGTYTDTVTVVLGAGV